MTARANAWPELPVSALWPTLETLQLWTQIVGKVRLSQTPWLNHGWHVTLRVTARGLSTGLIPHGAVDFEMEFDFIAGTLLIRVSDGGERRVALRPGAVAASTLRSWPRWRGWALRAAST